MSDITKIASNIEHDATAAMDGNAKAVAKLRDELHALNSDQLKALAPLLEKTLGKSSNPLFGGVNVHRNSEGEVDSITFVPPVTDRLIGGHAVQTSVQMNDFVDDAERLFDKLVPNKNGKLTFEDLLAETAKVRPGSPEATTLGTFMYYITNAKSGAYEFGITKKQLDSLRTSWQNFPDLKEAQSVMQEAIKCDRTLFGTKGISPDAIRMGPGDDTLFAAALADLAKKDPARLRAMIKDNHNGTYAVTIAPGHVFKVSAPNDAEMAMFNRGGDFGTWPIILEKAFRQLQNTSDTSPDGLGFLTNKKPEEINTLDFPRGLFSLILEKYMAGSGAVTALAVPFMENKTADGYPAGQAYSVLAFDPKGPEGGTVTLRNPRGGKDDTAFGEWKISLRSFQVNFNVIEGTSAKSEPFDWGGQMFVCLPGATLESCAIASEHSQN